MVESEKPRNPSDKSHPEQSGDFAEDKPAPDHEITMGGNAVTQEDQVISAPSDLISQSKPNPPVGGYGETTRRIKNIFMDIDKQATDPGGEELPSPPDLLMTEKPFNHQALPPFSHPISGASPATQSENTHQVCPYLGVIDDPGTSFAYPSTGNFCYRASPVQSVTILHQENCCLSSKHLSCIVYTSQQKISLPSEFAGGDIISKSLFSSIYQRAALSLGLILVVIVALLIAIGPGRPFLAALSQHVPTATVLPVVYISIPTPTPKPTSTATVAPALPTATILPSLTPSFTPTCTPAPPTPGPVFGEFFGPDKKFVLYQVKEGESISNIASMYGTTLDIIRLINQVIEGASIQPGTVLVIMKDAKEISQVNAFHVLQTQNDTTVNILAAEKNTTEEILRLYNDLGPSNIIPAGRWLILPVQE